MWKACVLKSSHVTGHPWCMSLQYMRRMNPPKLSYLGFFQAHWEPLCFASHVTLLQCSHHAVWMLELNSFSCDACIPIQDNCVPCRH